MRFLKLGLISVVVLFLIVTAIASLIPSTIVVSRSVEISKEPEEVISLVNDLGKWPDWLVNDDSSKTSVNTPAQELVINNTTVRLNKAEQKEVLTTWQAKKGRTMDCSIFAIPKNNGYTSLQWRFVLNLKWYPWEKFSSIASEKVLGPYIEQNLARIKLLAEKDRE